MNDDKGEGEWRSVKKLGSLAGEFEDVKRRIQLSSTAITKVDKLWFKKNIPVKHKIKI